MESLSHTTLVLLCVQDSRKEIHYEHSRHIKDPGDTNLGGHTSMGNHNLYGQKHTSWCGRKHTEGGVESSAGRTSRPLLLACGFPPSIRRSARSEASPSSRSLPSAPPAGRSSPTAASSICPPASPACSRPTQGGWPSFGDRV